MRTDLGLFHGRVRGVARGEEPRPLLGDVSRSFPVYVDRIGADAHWSVGINIIVATIDPGNVTAFDQFLAGAHRCRPGCSRRICRRLATAYRR
jgi:hypothetical protein